MYRNAMSQNETEVVGEKNENLLQMKACLHAVHVNPPTNVTARVGAVGQIHLTCI